MTIKKKKILIALYSCLFVIALALGATYYYATHSSYHFYFKTVEKRMYPLSRLLISTKLYDNSYSEFEDVYRLCHMNADFNYIKLVVQKQHVKIMFIPISQFIKEEEIDWFLEQGATINDLSFSMYKYAPPNKVEDDKYVWLRMPILSQAILSERHDLVPYLLEKGANPSLVINFSQGVCPIHDDVIQYTEKEHKDILYKTPREILEEKDKKTGKFTKEIELLKEYEIKFTEPTR